MISINSLYYHYPKSGMVLSNISTHFEQGNIYGLFGKNGEGKSTLLKIISGLLRAKSGEFSVNNENWTHRNAPTLEQLFLVPEDFELPKVTIATYEKITGPFYPNFSRKQFYDLIAEFKLSPKHHIARLSFGQKKKVLIAFGIAVNTSILLMDEPTNGLDIPSKSQFRKIMATIADENKCIIISTHQVRDLHSLINHVLVLDETKVVFDASLVKVSELFWFGKPKSTEDSALFTETGFGGKSVMARGDKDETEVDLELLFSAVLMENTAINTMLKNSTHV
ncbi:ATP-binding cassette domain-containing protein [uncultured Croceitalea sp.]|uniref:ABC transporter ATP-binding protein n=1 Tax=uncultured Croceitalea sp. TaxID=1798908 RepID=UPI0033060F83